MAVTERVGQLRDSELFSDLDEDALARIAADATEYDCPADTVLIEAGVPASGVFVVIEGTVVAETHGGRHHELGPGDSFGELSILTGMPRTGRVRALTPLRCLALDRVEFETILADEPAVTRALLGVLARRLVEAQSGRR